MQPSLVETLPPFGDRILHCDVVVRLDGAYDVMLPCNGIFGEPMPRSCCIAKSGGSAEYFLVGNQLQRYKDEVTAESGQHPRGRRARLFQGGYCLKTTGGPLTRFPTSATVTSTRLAILMKGMPLFIP